MGEKWNTYDNPDRRLQGVHAGETPELVPKKELREKEDMLSFLFSVLGPIYWEILADSTTVDADLFSKQQKIVAIRIPPSLLSEGKILILIDNSRPQNMKITQKKKEELGIEWLPHPPYSPDISPCDYHCFPSLSDFSKGNKFNNRDDVERAFTELTISKPSGF